MIIKYLTSEISFNYSIIQYILENKIDIKEIINDTTVKKIEKIKKIKENIIKQNNKKNKKDKKLRGISILSVYLHFIILFFFEMQKKQNLYEIKKSKYNNYFKKYKENLLKKDLLFNENLMLIEEIYDIFLYFQYNTGNLNNYIVNILNNQEIKNEIKKKTWYNYIEDNYNKNNINDFNIIILGYKDYVMNDLNTNLKFLFNYFEKNKENIIDYSIQQKIKEIIYSKQNKKEIIQKIKNLKFFNTKNQIFFLINTNIIEKILKNLTNLILKDQKEFPFILLKEKDKNDFLNNKLNKIKNSLITF